MGLTVARCPACGANLNLEINRDFFYCPHCGSKVVQVDDRIVIEHVNRTIDEAEVRKNEFEREKYFLEEKKKEEDREKNLKRSKPMMIVGLIAILIGYIIYKVNPNSYDATGFFFMYIGFLIAFVGFMAFLTSYFRTSRNDFSNSSDNKQK